MSNIIDPENTQDRALDFNARARIFAALARLQDARDQAAGLAAIREVAALLGSEEVAVFKADQRKAVLWLYWCVGVDPNRYVCLDAAREPGLASVLNGRIVFSGVKSDERLLSLPDPVSAMIPILVNGKVAGVIVIFRLLPQKIALNAADRHACHVLSTRASRAIQPMTDNHDAIEEDKENGRSA